MSTTPDGGSREKVPKLLLRRFDKFEGGKTVLIVKVDVLIKDVMSVKELLQNVVLTKRGDLIECEKKGKKEG